MHAGCLALRVHYYQLCLFPFRRRVEKKKDQSFPYYASYARFRFRRIITLSLHNTKYYVYTYMLTLFVEDAERNRSLRTRYYYVKMGI